MVLRSAVRRESKGRCRARVAAVDCRSASAGAAARGCRCAEGRSVAPGAAWCASPAPWGGPLPQGRRVSIDRVLADMQDRLPQEGLAGVKLLAPHALDLLGDVRP